MLVLAKANLLLKKKVANSVQFSLLALAILK